MCLDRLSRTNYCAKFEVIPIRSFRFIVLTRARVVILMIVVVVLRRRTRMNKLLDVYTVRSSERLVGPTQATSDWWSDQSDRPVGQTVAEPPTSVNQINVAC